MDSTLPGLLPYLPAILGQNDSKAGTMRNTTESPDSDMEHCSVSHVKLRFIEPL